MRRLAIAALAVSALAGARTARGADLENAPGALSWFDLDLDFGGGVALIPDAPAGADDGEGVYFQRLRGGYSWIRGWKFWSLFASADTFDFDRFAFGIGGDVVSIGTGLGASLGVTVSTDGDLGFNGGVGWSFFHVEAQYLTDDPGAWAFVGYVRIPVGAITYARWGVP